MAHQPLLWWGCIGLPNEFFRKEKENDFMKSKHLKWVGAIGLGSLALAGGYVSAQNRQQNPQGPPFGPGFGGPGGFGGPPQEEAVPLPPSKTTVEEREGYRYITSNGIPNHEVGAFPNPGNPNAIRAQSYKFRVPLQPKIAEKPAILRHDLFGVASSGVPFDPATAEFWNNDRRWNYDALSGKINLGTDINNAHVQPGGVYHYHGLPEGLIAKLNKVEKKDARAVKEAKEKQITMLGYAADGFPIYAQQGLSIADDAKSPLKKLRSSFRLKEGNRPAGNEGPGGAYDGTFSADWEYVAKSGDLDECNGRQGVTPEYPQGTYYYVLTDEFPFIPRSFKGTPDTSFTKPRPQGGPGGQGGPNGGPGGRGGRPPGPGFGPPPPGFGPPPPGFGPPPPGFGPPPPGA